MIKQTCFLVIALIFSSSLTCLSQDEILFLNGDSLILDDYKKNDINNTLAYKLENDKVNIVYLDHIFSITDNRGIEEIIYKKDSLVENYFTVEEMRSYVYGARTAKTQNKAPWAFAGGVFFGGTAPYIIPVLYSPLIPATFSAAVYATKPSEKNVIEKNPEYKNDPYFINGYREIAKQKRLNSSLKGSAVGIILGIVSIIVIQ